MFNDTTSRNQTTGEATVMEEPVPSGARTAAARKSSGSEPYIRRLEPSFATGGNWRVTLHRTGQTYTKSFFDSVHGSTGAALEAAKTWRDNTFRALPMLSKAQAVVRVRSDNASGVPGVRRVSQARKTGRVADFWLARSPRLPGGAERTKIFSIARYGEERAYAMAVQARAAFVAELACVPHVPHRPAKQMMHVYADAQLVGTPPKAAKRIPRRTCAESPPAPPRYGAARLLDAVLRTLCLDSDHALSRALTISPVVISRLRYNRLPVTPEVLQRIQNVTGIGLADLEGMLTPLGASHG